MNPTTLRTNVHSGQETGLMSHGTVKLPREYQKHLVKPVIFNSSWKKPSRDIYLCTYPLT